MSEYLDNIDNDIAEKHLLKHPFYLAWARGELSKEAAYRLFAAVLSSCRRVSDVSLSGARELR